MPTVSRAVRALDAIGRVGDSPLHSAQGAVKPLTLWVPSQKGLFSEPPQRQSAARVASRTSSALRIVELEVAAHE